MEEMIRENKYNLEMVKKYGLDYDFIDDKYEINI
jgi:hypothetical protein